MVVRQEVNELWHPSKYISMAQCELHEAQQWVVSRKTPLSPRTPPKVPEMSPTKGALSPVLALGDKDVSPARSGDRDEMILEGDEVVPDGNEIASEGDDVESGDEGEGSAGPGSPGRPIPWVVIMDQRDHPLTASLWVRLGAVRRAGQIRVKVWFHLLLCRQLLFTFHRGNWCIRLSPATHARKGRRCVLD